MRKSTRILALILMALMLVGMMPFSLFADETTSNDGGEASGAEGKTHAELLTDYVGADKLWFAGDYTGKAGSQYTSGNHTVINSTGMKDLFVTDKGVIDILEDGTIHVHSNESKTATASYVNVYNHSTANTGDPTHAGKNVVFEFSIKFDENGITDGRELDIFWGYERGTDSAQVTTSSSDTTERVTTPPL